MFMDNQYKIQDVEEWLFLSVSLENLIVGQDDMAATEWSETALMGDRLFLEKSSHLLSCEAITCFSMVP